MRPAFLLAALLVLAPAEAHADVMTLATLLAGGTIAAGDGYVFSDFHGYAGVTDPPFPMSTPPNPSTIFVTATADGLAFSGALAFSSDQFATGETFGFTAAATGSAPPMGWITETATANLGPFDQPNFFIPSVNAAVGPAAMEFRNPYLEQAYVATRTTAGLVSALGVRSADLTATFEATGADLDGGVSARLDTVSFAVSAVPEPSASALAGLALAAASLAVSRKRARAS